MQKLSLDYLFNFSDANITSNVSSAVEEEMYRLRENAKVDFSLPLLYNIPEFKILYHNARSLHKHFCDLKKLCNKGCKHASFFRNPF